MLFKNIYIITYFDIQKVIKPVLDYETGCKLLPSHQETDFLPWTLYWLSLANQTLVSMS